MSAPLPLKHVKPPDWFGVPLINGATADGAAAALATSSDFGGLGSGEGTLGDEFNGYGAVGTALSQYEKSMLDEAYLYGGSDALREGLRVVEAGAAVVADFALGQIEVFSTGGVIPVVDKLVKSAVPKLRIGVADTMLDGIRAALVLAGGRPEDKARLRARAQVDELSRLGKWIVTVYDDGLSQTIANLANQLKEKVGL